MGKKIVLTKEVIRRRKVVNDVVVSIESERWMD